MELKLITDTDRLILFQENCRSDIICGVWTYVKSRLFKEFPEIIIIMSKMATKQFMNLGRK